MTKFNFEELNDLTRKYMLMEFEAEEQGGMPYRSSYLSSAGSKMFPALMAQAIRNGNEETLEDSLRHPNYWIPFDTRTRAGHLEKYRVNPANAARMLASSEFNTWYVRGFARRLIEEGEEFCRVYRAAPALQPRTECMIHEGQIYRLQDIYDGHRRRYWVEPIDKNALSIPTGPNCHHTIGRIK